ncbi:hypothetical protein BYT27DRAFT_7186515, partial [Phlegmacium glaucopus]
MAKLLFFVETCEINEPQIYAVEVWEEGRPLGAEEVLTGFRINGEDHLGYSMSLGPH